MRLSRALIYLSFISIPGAETLGLLPLIGFYNIMILVLAFWFMITKENTIPLSSMLYILSIPALLLINFYIADLQQIDTMVWLARSIHLAVIPFFYLAFKFSDVPPKVLLKDLFICGLIEVVLIYGTFIWYFDVSQLRRASDIEGIIIYSLLLVFSGFYCLDKFNETGNKKYLFIYAFITFSTFLTGSRSLTIAVLMMLLILRNKLVIISIVLSSSLIGLLFAGNSLIERYDFTQQENLITIFSKFEELWILFNLFLENPPFGSGLGKIYKVSIASTEYTYSHNILLFYLGYIGLIGVLLAIYPLIRLMFNSRYRIMVIAILFFYTSSTTYTNFKHSLFLAIMLVLLEHISLMRKKASSPSITMHSYPLKSEL